MATVPQKPLPAGKSVSKKEAGVVIAAILSIASTSANSGIAPIAIDADAIRDVKEFVHVLKELSTAFRDLVSF